MASDSRMVALGFGKFARADRIFALERITGDERGDGRRTRVWIDGVADPLIASRTEVTILRDMDQESAVAGPDLDEALDLAARLADAVDAGRVDLGDLGRRARTSPGVDHGGTRIARLLTFAQVDFEGDYPQGYVLAVNAGEKVYMPLARQGMDPTVSKRRQQNPALT